MRTPIDFLLAGDTILLGRRGPYHDPRNVTTAEVIGDHFSYRPGFYEVWCEGETLTVFVTFEGQRNLAARAPRWAIDAVTPGVLPVPSDGFEISSTGVC